jgi:hypothetical protein
MLLLLVMFDLDIFRTNVNIESEMISNCVVKAIILLLFCNDSDWLKSIGNWQYSHVSLEMSIKK